MEELLKLDPGNTELLAQKHKLLSQAVSETKEKLETLKTAQEQANEALRNGTISQEQYDGLQREIIETENELRRLEEQANQSATALQKISATGEKLKTAEAIGLMANAGIKSSQAGTALRTIMNNLTGDVKLSGAAFGEVTIATTNADGSMRGLSDILADCRAAFDQMSESEKANAAETLVGKNAM